MGGSTEEIIIRILVLVIAITIHEFAHAICADRLGDPTPRRDGRISLLPPDHFEPVGAIMMVVSSVAGFGIGWGKPVMVNPMNLRNPRKAMGLVAAAGPASNLMQASLFAALYHALVPAGVGHQLEIFLVYGVIVNLTLAFFNLIPLGPLDGAKVVTAYLPHREAWAFQAWMDRYGMMAFMVMILLGFQIGIVGMLIGPPVNYCLKLLGVPYHIG